MQRSKNARENIQEYFKTFTWKQFIHTQFVTKGKKCLQVIYYYRKYNKSSESLSSLVFQFEFNFPYKMHLNSEDVNKVNF